MKASVVKKVVDHILNQMNTIKKQDSLDSYEILKLSRRIKSLKNILSKQQKAIDHKSADLFTSVIDAKFEMTKNKRELINLSAQVNQLHKQRSINKQKKQDLYSLLKEVSPIRKKQGTNESL